MCLSHLNSQNKWEAFKVVIRFGGNTLSFVYLNKIGLYSSSIPLTSD